MTREGQIDWLCRLRTDLNNGMIFTPWNKEFTEALNDVLEQEPKTGHWDSIQGYIMDIAWHCSECGEFTCKKHNYCPNCGAKMESEET